MSYCLNPDCQNPQNIDGVEFCQSCNSKLLLKERYRALQVIGQGGFGKTFLAIDEDKPSKPKCVIKQFLPQAQGLKILKKAAELFEQEAVRLDELGKHPQIPELFAHFEQDALLYLVQEFIDGNNLAQELAEVGAFDETKIRQLLKSLLPVLEFVHSHQVIHRDVKPENIIRRRQDGQLVLVDFGAAKLMTETALLETGTMIGSLKYAAPEQAEGKANFASDVYSLGVTCLYLLTNVDRFELFDTSENKWVWRNSLTTEISDSLGKILDKTVQLATKRRYQSATEVLQELDQPTIPTPVSPSASSASKLWPLKLDKKWGYIDETGEMIIDPQFGWADGFSSGLASVRMSGKWGYIDSKGGIAIQPHFDGVEPFSADGIAAVKTGEKWGYINSNGEVIKPPKFDEAESFSAGLAAVKLGGKWGYIDQTGRVVIRHQFEVVRSFAQGLAWVKMPSKWLGIVQTGCKWGCIDTTGRLVVETEFDEVYSLSEGLAGFKIGEKYGYIDQMGQVVIEPEFDINSFCLLPPNFSEGFAMVRMGSKWGYINKTGKVIIEPHFTQAGSFSVGLAAVKLDDKWGYIDQTGQIVIPPQFDQAYLFSDSDSLQPNHSQASVSNVLTSVQPKLGLAMVRIGNEWRYIDKTGRFIGSSWRW
ncbi:MAG: WG repeat-containing protein [Coleofasciculaceae cyanobacterium]